MQSQLCSDEKSLSGNFIKNPYFADTFEEAVMMAVEIAEPGEAVLLSPACASWGMFDNYEQRGDMFKEQVRGYLK